jgi:hypothetical protein
MQVFVIESIVCFLYALSATTVFVLLHLFFAWFIQYGLAVKLLQSEDLVMTFLFLLDCAMSWVCKISLFCNCADIICSICHWLWWHQSKHLVALYLGCKFLILLSFWEIVLLVNAFSQKLSSVCSGSWMVAGNWFWWLQVGNLSSTALETHVWYKTKFEDYPESRRALLPYIFWRECKLHMNCSGLCNHSTRQLIWKFNCNPTYKKGSF